MVVAVDCDGDGKERSETALGVTGVQKRKQGAEGGTNSVQYSTTVQYSRMGLRNATLDTETEVPSQVERRAAVSAISLQRSVVSGR